MESTTANKSEWHVIDGSVENLGRMSTTIASLLLGKHRTDSKKHTVSPVNVVVLNSDTLKVTGKKHAQKMYRRYTGYPGGLRERTLDEQMKRDSTFIIRQAVSGMLPKNNLRDERLKHLFIYPGSKHPHMAQTNNTTI